MKQAILITAFKNFNQLAEIAEFFDEDFSVYVHIDKKSEISSEEFTTLNAIPNIELISQKYKVNWGGRNHLRCILFLISEALKDKEGFVRTAAASALGQIKDSQAIPFLMEALKKETGTQPFHMYPGGMQDVPNYGRMAYALGSINESTPVPTLIEWLKDRSLRARAIFTLGKIDDNEAVPFLIDLLQDKNKEIRSEAVTALGSIGDERAIPFLVSRLQSARRLL